MSTSSKPRKFTGPKGVPDYVPPNSHEFDAVRSTFQHCATTAGYEPVELPIFEDTSLFARGVGESSDVVTKEMYTFEDRGGRSVTLRPEGTAGVMRAVIEHGLDRGQLPVKLAYAGPCFRYERPQAGRYRQFQQVGVEAIGADDPALDVEVIALAYRSFARIGLSGFRLELTSLGDSTCRPAYKEALQTFLRSLPLDEETQRRVEINPLRILDDKRPEVKDMTADAPLMLDYLSGDAREHFDTVTGLLDDLSIPYTINPRMVRGLDYYTKTCFEFVHDDLGAQSGIGGGGRYDGLMAELGGRDLSGVGFGLGVERALLALETEKKTVTDGTRVDIYGVPMGGEACRRMPSIIDALRQSGVRADMAYGRRSLKGSMKAADRAGARFAVVLGDDELAGSAIQLKDLQTGEQTTISLDTFVDEVHRRLASPSQEAIQN
ncbi:histidine--tRNA ligase [Corynebacterium kroppenstedtii]|uniref:histidine--tRNA ligase n=1 Tax=Corynebacterium sp. PCR 32 TaxID=3351342 RepID=UPI00309B9A04